MGRVLMLLSLVACGDDCPLVISSGEFWIVDWTCREDCDGFRDQKDRLPPAIHFREDGTAIDVTGLPMTISQVGCDLVIADFDGDSGVSVHMERALNWQSGAFHGDAVVTNAFGQPWSVEVTLTEQPE